MSKFDQFIADYATYEATETGFREYHCGLITRALDQFDICLHQVIASVLKEMLRFQRHCGEIKRLTLDRLEAASRGLRDSIEHSCGRLLQSFNTGVASIHFQKLKLQEERWFHNFGQACADIAHTRDSFIAAKEAMDTEVTRFIDEKITSNRDDSKFLLEILATETSNVMDMFNSNRISSSGLRHAAQTKWQGVLRENVALCEKNRRAAEVTPSIEKDALHENDMVLRDAMVACRDIVKASSRETKNIIYTIEEPRRAHKDHMDGLVKDTRRAWNDIRNEITPLAGNYEKEFDRELSLMKSRCIDVINKYVHDETAYLADVMLHERGSIITSFRKHFSTFDLHENVLFTNFNREIQHTVNEFVRLWGPVKPYHLATFGETIQLISLNYIDDLQRHIISTFGTIDVSDDSILSRMEIADTLFCALDACIVPAKKLPELYVEERADQLQMINDMSLKAGDDINRPQVEAVLDVLIRGLEIEGKVNEGYEDMNSLTKKKGAILAVDLEEFMVKYLNENAQSAAIFAKGLLDRIHVRGLEVAALLDAAVAHILADHSRLNVDTAAAVKEIDVWEQEQYAVVDETFEKVREAMLKPVFPSPVGTPRLDPVEQAALDREKATQRARELIEMMDQRNFTNDGDAVLDVVELAKGWLECLTKSGKVFFYNTTSGQSLWNRPPDLPLLNQTEKDFNYDGDDRDFDTPRQDDAEAPASVYIQRREQDSLVTEYIDKDELVTAVINRSAESANLILDSAIRSIMNAGHVRTDELVYFKQDLHKSLEITKQAENNLLELGMGSVDSGSVSSMSFTAERPAPFIVTRESLLASKPPQAKGTKELRFSIDTPVPDVLDVNPASIRGADDVSPAWSSLKAALDAQLEGVAFMDTQELDARGPPTDVKVIEQKNQSLFEQWDALSPSRTTQVASIDQPDLSAHVEASNSDPVVEDQFTEDSYRSVDTTHEQAEVNLDPDGQTEIEATHTSATDGFVECYTEDGNLYYYNEATGESVWTLPSSGNQQAEQLEETPVDLVGDIAQLEKQILEAKKELTGQSDEPPVESAVVVENRNEVEVVPDKPAIEPLIQTQETLPRVTSEFTLGSLLTSSQVIEPTLVLDDNLNLTEDVAELTLFFRSCSLGRTTAKKAAVNAVQHDITTAKKLTKMWAKGHVNNPKGVYKLH